jgi:hypothetical protein
MYGTIETCKAPAASQHPKVPSNVVVCPAGGNFEVEENVVATMSRAPKDTSEPVWGAKKGRREKNSSLRRPPGLSGTVASGREGSHDDIDHQEQYEEANMHDASDEFQPWNQRKSPAVRVDQALDHDLPIIQVSILHLSNWVGLLICCQIAAARRLGLWTTQQASRSLQWRS